MKDETETHSLNSYFTHYDCVCFLTLRLLVNSVSAWKLFKVAKLSFVHLFPKIKVIKRHRTGSSCQIASYLPQSGKN